MDLGVGDDSFSDVRGDEMERPDFLGAFGRSCSFVWPVLPKEDRRCYGRYARGCRRNQPLSGSSCWVVEIGADVSEFAVTNIWLIRHGEPCESSRGRCYGKLDVGLSARGRDQIAAVANFLRGELLDVIYSSPRTRTAESARILAGGRNCEVKIEDRLCEIDFGDFEGRSYDELSASHPEIYRQWMETPTEIQFPNGESFEQMRRRVLAAFDGIREQHRGENVALVTHGGVNRMILAYALGIPHVNIFRISQDYAALNLLQYIGNYPSVRYLNTHCSMNGNPKV